MRTGMVVVVVELGEDADKVPLAGDDQKVETLAPGGLDQASAKEFARGDRYGVSATLAPAAWKTASN